MEQCAKYAIYHIMMLYRILFCLVCCQFWACWPKEFLSETGCMLAQAGFTTPEVRPRRGVNSPLAPPHEEVTGTPPEISVFSQTCFPACCVRKFQTHAGPIGCGWAGRRRFEEVVRGDARQKRPAGNWVGVIHKFREWKSTMIQGLLETEHIILCSRDSQHAFWGEVGLVFLRFPPAQFWKIYCCIVCLGKKSWLRGEVSSFFYWF